MASSLVKLISTAIFKRRTKYDTSDSVLEDNVHPMVVLPLRLLNSALRDPVSVILAVNSGVLKVLLNAHPCILSFDDSPTRQPPEIRFSDWTLSVLKRISRLMVHPEPSRVFLSTSRKIGVDGPKGDLQVKSPALWNFWKSTKVKGYAPPRH
ncbi:hypothetical protein PM082_012472 [Marasmius tenuissimus]|nr:hypothetical protein PM082_012472 [Marasmius tenuissimus]